MERTVARATTFTDVLAERAALSPGTAFESVTTDASGPSLTFPQLHDRARSLGALLADRIAPGERVLVLLPSGLDYVAAFLGCLYAGVVAVPLYPPEGGAHAARLRAVLADCAPAAALVPASFLERPEASAAGLAGLPLIAADGELPDPGDWRRPRTTGDTPAFLQYTSGSTATPKGVVVTHRNLVANSRQIRRRFGSGPDTPVVSWLPPYHDMGLIGGILQPVFAGAPATLMSPMSFITRPLRWLRLISERGARISGGPDFAYDLCVDRIPEHDLEGLDLSHWDIAFNGAEPVRAATLERFTARMAPYGFRRGAFLPCYGLAEATLLVSGEVLGDREPAETFSADSLAPGERPAPDPAGLPVVDCGPAAEELTVAIADPRSGAPCPPGTVGEIWVSGDNVAAGYWGREDDGTFGAVLPDDGRRYLRTGDLGFLRDGRLHVTGRSKDLIVVRGRNHYPQDLERTALDAHPTLRRGAAAFSLDESICLVLETSTAHRPGEAAEVTSAVRARLAREHGVTPGAVLLVRPGRLPRTTSGKIQRSRARALLAAGELEAVHRWDAGRDTQPLSRPAAQGSVRDTLLALASRRLGAAVDPSSPLVAQGLDSLAALELRAAAEDALGAELSLEALLAGASVDELAAGLPGHGPVAPAPDRSSPEPHDAPAEGRHPLSYGQRSLWFAERQQPGSALFHLQLALRLLTEVDAGALHRALQALVDRHPALRTALRQGEDGTPYQEVLARQDMVFATEDAGHLDEGLLRARLSREARGEHIDPSDGRLLQALLLRRPDGDVLSVTVHHVAVDMWSLTLLADELGRLYAYETGRGDVPPAPAATGPVQLAYRQRALLGSERGHLLSAYWRRELDGCPPVLELPADRPRPPVRGSRGGTVTLEIDGSLATALRERAREEGTTLFTALLAVFQSQLHRWTGQDDFLVGVPASGRVDAELHNAVGYFVNPVLIRSRMDARRGFADQLRETRERLAGAMQHQDFPFSALVEQLGLPRDPARTPGYQVLFTFDRPHRDATGDLAALVYGGPGARVRLDELTAESMGLHRQSAQTDLSVVVTEAGDRLHVAFDYAADLFDHGTVESFAADFRELAARLVEQPGTPLGDLPGAGEAELRRIAAWNDTATGYPRTATVPELFGAQVAERPDAPALTYGDLTFSYRELDRVSNALARRLRASGVGPESPVALHLDREPAAVVAMLAVAKAGGAYVPLDPALPPYRLAQILDDARPAAVLTVDGRPPADALPADCPPALAARAFLTEQVASDPAEDRPVAPSGTRPGPDGLLYVMYTSGTSGTPKGVCVTHRCVVSLVRETDFVRLDPGDRMAQISNLAFDSATLEVWGALLNGMHLIGFDRDTVLSPPRLAAALRDRRIGTMLLPTPLFHELTAYDPSVFSTVDQVLVGGDVMDPRHAAAVARLRGPLLSNGYGPTETTTYATTHVVRDIPDTTRRLPIGGPVANTTLHVLDERLRPVPVGVPGQLYIGGTGLARGYLRNARLTAERFLPDPFATEPGARMYATGDRVRRLPDGTLDYLGRVDFQVKVRGFRVEPADIDAALIAHPRVREAVTVPDGSPGGRRLVSYYSGPAEPAELRAHLASRLPEYMVPALLIRLDELPKNPSRKIDRSALPHPGDHPGPTTAEETEQDTGLSGEIAVLMADLLDRSRVGPDDNFFQLGGHSLLAVRLLTRVRDRYGVELALNELLLRPTARAVAEQIVRAETTRTTPTTSAIPGPVAVPRSAYARTARRP
ncbi:amino acid adenylation domain-containing protein [Streptomyces sp. NPDC052644]